MNVIENEGRGKMTLLFCKNCCINHLHIPALQRLNDLPIKALGKMILLVVSAFQQTTVQARQNNVPILDTHCETQLRHHLCLCVRTLRSSKCQLRKPKGLDPSPKTDFEEDDSQAEQLVRSSVLLRPGAASGSRDACIGLGSNGLRARTLPEDHRGDCSRNLLLCGSFGANFCTRSPRRGWLSWRSIDTPSRQALVIRRPVQL